MYSKRNFFNCKEQFLVAKWIRNEKVFKVTKQQLLDIPFAGVNVVAKEL